MPYEEKETEVPHEHLLSGTCANYAKLVKNRVEYDEACTIHMNCLSSLLYFHAVGDFSDA